MILAVYGEKVFIADVQRGVARAVMVKNLDDVNNVEVNEGQFAGLALDLCRREPDRLSRVLCLAVG